VFRLTRQIPSRIALGLLLTGRRFTAPQALQYGLVNEVAPQEKLDDVVDGWVEDVLGCAPLSVRAVKEAAQTSAGMPLERAFATRYPWEERRMHSADAIEGPRAFAQKRPPKWLGR
jgi:dehydration protein DpgD